ncbi:hypothetical protein [Clostridium sp.]|uniref:hypothetical protein n=1 Tax=Clostridium sp. TaxID=1506 RepID=UPI0039F57831
MSIIKNTRSEIIDILNKVLEEETDSYSVTLIREILSFINDYGLTPFLDKT